MAWCHQSPCHYLIQCWPLWCHFVSLGHNKFTFILPFYLVTGCISNRNVYVRSGWNSRGHTSNQVMLSTHHMIGDLLVVIMKLVEFVSDGINHPSMWLMSVHLVDWTSLVCVMVCLHQQPDLYHMEQGQFTTLRLRQNGRHFTDDIFNYIFLNEKVWISIKISVNYIQLTLNQRWFR